MLCPDMWLPSPLKKKKEKYEKSFLANCTAANSLTHPYSANSHTKLRENTNPGLGRVTSTSFYQLKLKESVGEAETKRKQSLPVMLLVHQVVSCPESHQAGIVGRCWDRNRTCASYISVAQLVCQDLEFICCETVVIPKHIVMGWAAGTLGRKGG